MAALCRFLFFFVLVKPIAVVVLGLNVRRKHLLPTHGPAILVANHNSHLDTLVLLSLFPYNLATQIRPVAAADYFCRHRALAWLMLNVLRIIPVDRTARMGTVQMLEGVSGALSHSEIVLLFPEGTRGEPEHLNHFKSGIAHVAKQHPDIPVIPVFVHGAGKALPRGEAILVPFFCDIFVGEPMLWCEARSKFMDALEQCFHQLAREGDFTPWT
jgi:1-acyl-sn-glycerol-3-phosphate acyltransferase